MERRYLSHSRTAEILRKTASLKSDNRLLLSGGQKRLSRWRPFAILNFRDPKNGIFEKRVQDFLLVVNNKLPSFFKKTAFLCTRFRRQTDRQTEKPVNRIIALSRRGLTFTWGLIFYWRAPCLILLIYSAWS